MTQRIFDIENEKDMQDLWDILPDDVNKIEKYPDGVIDPFAGFCVPSKHIPCRTLIKINWHDKTEITRPIQEATEQDIGKLCAFYDEPATTDDKPYIYYAVLHKIENQSRNTWFYTDRCDYFTRCRRLTRQEIEELC
jgi:hypothetical protein